MNSTAKGQHKRKILCLHGRRTNTTVIKFQVQQLKRFLRGTEAGDIEFVFMNAPNKTEEPADPLVGQLFNGPYFEWWTAHEQSGGDTGGGSGGGGGIAGGVQYDGVDASLRSAVDVLLQQGPFEALLGFSQGTMMVFLLTALRYYADFGAPDADAAGVPTLPAYVRELVPKLRGVPPWHMVLLASGLAPRVSGWEVLWSVPLPIASVHILSAADPVYESSKALVHLFAEGPADDAATSSDSGTGVEQAVSSAASGSEARAVVGAGGERGWRYVIEHSEGHRFPTAQAMAAAAGGDRLFYEVLRDAVLAALRVGAGAAGAAHFRPGH